MRTNLAGATVAVTGPSTVKIETAEPNADAAERARAARSGHRVEKVDRRRPKREGPGNGTGPFVLKAYEPSVRAMLEKNPGYFIKGQPYLNAVEFRMIKSDDARVNALRTNAVDMIDFVPWKDIDTLRRAPNIVVDSSGGAFMNLWFNATKKPYNDVRVRQAFAYAIDRDAISKAAFFGHGTPIEGPPTAADSPFYNKELAKTYKYDPARAKALLAAAGYPNGFDFEFLVFQGLGIYTSTAQIVQANLKDVGINAKIQLVEFADLLDRKNKATYDVMIYGVSMKLTDPDAYAYYLGADSTYWAKPIGYRDEVLEKLLSAGRSTVDLDSRKVIYQKVEQRVMDTSPWVFINFREQAQAYNKKVRGYSHLGGALNESSAGISMPVMWMQ